MTVPKNIVIVGGGFCGIMTAVNLIQAATSPLKITLINSGGSLVRGVAYNTYSPTHLLNVATGSMSAFPDNTGHFTEWVHSKEEYREYEKDLLSATFLPRNLYGEYLSHIWNGELESKRGDTDLNSIDDYVTDLEFLQRDEIKIILRTGSSLLADYVVLATGNSLPRNPPIANMDYYSCSTYFRNPWSIDSVSNFKPEGDILIIGNGLTMVDTVVGLIENGFPNKIYAVSTNGFGVLPHRHFGIKYDGLINELPAKLELNKLVSTVNKHIKKIRKLGISAGPVIDSLRPYSQKIWQSFTLEEKKRFISRYRYMWGVARHRLPVFIYDTIEKLRINGQLEVYEGKLIDINENENGVFAKYFNARNRANETLKIQRVINCTGPETSIYKTTNPLLQKLAGKGIISSDPLELGINTDVSTFNILNSEGKKYSNLFTLGTNLKGMLWETVAVPELRDQCKQLADILLQVSGEN